MFRNSLEIPVVDGDRSAHDAHAPAKPAVRVRYSHSELHTARSETIGEALARTEHILLARQTERLLAAVENIRDGLAIFDRHHRLVMTNQRYIEMYALPEELQHPGTPFDKLAEHWDRINFFTNRPQIDQINTARNSATSHKVLLRTTRGRVYDVHKEPMPHGGWVSTHEDITERVAAEEQIRFMAERDPLTGLYNHATFQERVAGCLRAAAEAASSGRNAPAHDFALVMLDINKFRAINEIHGHSVGDAVLIEIAARIHSVVGEDAVLARLGGDQFALVVNAPDRQKVDALAHMLLNALRDPIRVPGMRLEITASVGICFSPSDGSQASRLLKAAERAVHAAQHLGMGPCVLYHTGLDAEENARADLIRALPNAMATGELALHFQPIIDAQTGRCRSAEALLRWTHPVLGRISPEAAIAAAEESRLIGALGTWIVDRALQAAATWPDDVTVAVNLSASQLRDAGFVDHVNASLDRSGVRPQRLELELTETVLCSDEAVETISALRAEGIRFSLDDFGTGYASMSYLLRFPFDRVKIDRSFVTNVHERRDRRLIVEAVAGLATKLGLEVVAEGVETEAEQAVVQSAGCTFLQGYLFSRPLPEAAFATYLRANAEATAHLCAGTEATTAAAEDPIEQVPLAAGHA